MKNARVASALLLGTQPESILSTRDSGISGAQYPERIVDSENGDRRGCPAQPLRTSGASSGRSSRLDAASVRDGGLPASWIRELYGIKVDLIS